ncbi:MAG: VOC family protein [Bacteroidota bacterium]|nr:VOC family protein [Bacteroidota bacterium]
MIKQLWINLPAKDIQASKVFFTKIGFEPNPHHDPGPDGASFFVGTNKMVLMLFQESTFSHVIQHPIANTALSSEVLLSFDAESREEVDEMAQLVKNAGGNVFAPPTVIQGWMYGCAFTDLDGHRWNSLYMDMSKQ